MESNIQGSLLLPLLRVGFISSPFRSPIARSSIGGLFFFFFLFLLKFSLSVQREVNGLAPAERLRFLPLEGCVPWKVRAVRWRAQRGVLRARRAVGKRPQGCKYCSTASHAARNVSSLERGCFSLLLEHPDTSDSVCWDSTFF